MNTRLFLLSILGLLPTALLVAGEDAPATPPPVSQVSVPPSAAVSSGEEQKLYAPPATLIAPEQARAIVDKFKDAYAKLGNPRVLIYVNRELLDISGGLKLTRRVETTDATRSVTKNGGAPDAPAAAPAPVPANSPATGETGAAPSGPSDTRVHGETTTEHISAENTYTTVDSPRLTLADRQTVRDVERLFGRPLRVAGVTLADQATATALIADRPLKHLAAADNDLARKDRDALQKVADVVIEVLISSRAITVNGVSGDQTYQVPDIQATAIRLKDAAILGQASATDVLGRKGQAARLVRSFDVNDIAEATALALMEDLTLSAK